MNPGKDMAIPEEGCGLRQSNTVSKRLGIQGHVYICQDGGFDGNSGEATLIGL